MFGGGGVRRPVVVVGLGFDVAVTGARVCVAVCVCAVVCVCAADVTGKGLVVEIKVFVEDTAKIENSVIFISTCFFFFK